MNSTLVAVIVGVLQGIFEWLPISSEGNVTVALTALGYEPAVALQYSLFLHVGTAFAAAVYYRETVVDVISTLPDWHPSTAFDENAAQLSFLAIATVTSGIVGIAAYTTIEHVVSALTGGAVVALIGLLLIGTGILQRLADHGGVVQRTQPGVVDALLVGALQGLAILPGISRSGTTVSALLLRGHDGESSFRLSFLLSIPAALGAGALVVLDTGGLPTLGPAPALISLVVAAVVGYLTIDVLMRVVRRITFWAVCLGLGVLATAGGLLAMA